MFACNQRPIRGHVSTARAPLQVHPVKAYPEEAGLDWPMIEQAFTSNFVPKLRVRFRGCTVVLYSF